MVAVTTKSEAKPVVAPPRPMQVIVQLETKPILNGFGVTQVRIEAAVGSPYTRKEGLPFRTICPSKRTRTKNEVELVKGTVVNVKVNPPSKEVGIIPELLVDEIAKSAATPVVAITALDTVKTHGKVIPTRKGLGVLQDKIDAVVGYP